MTLFLGILGYAAILWFAVRFFQAVHGWDEQMAELYEKKIIDKLKKNKQTATRKKRTAQ